MYIVDALTTYCMDMLEMLPDGMNGFTALEELEIFNCLPIEKFPEGLVRRLPALKSLIIRDCPFLVSTRHDSLIRHLPNISSRSDLNLSNIRPLLLFSTF